MHAKSLSPTARRAFELSVEQWIKDRVARHKQLRGGEEISYMPVDYLLISVGLGVVVLNAIPKRLD